MEATLGELAARRWPAERTLVCNQRGRSPASAAGGFLPIGSLWRLSRWDWLIGDWLIGD